MFFTRRYSRKNNLTQWAFAQTEKYFTAHAFIKMRMMRSKIQSSGEAHDDDLLIL